MFCNYKISCNLLFPTEKIKIRDWNMTKTRIAIRIQGCTHPYLLRDEIFQIKIVYENIIMSENKLYLISSLEHGSLLNNFQNSVSTTKKTQNVSFTKINLLMLFRKIIMRIV
jgi:hypothetical protein